MSCCSPKKNNDYQTGCCSPQPKQSQQQGCCSSSPTEIHRQMTIEDILGMFPFKAQQLSQEITNAGLHCIGCHAAVWETLEGGMLTHGKTDAEIDAIVLRLN